MLCALAVDEESPGPELAFPETRETANNVSASYRILTLPCLFALLLVTVFFLPLHMLFAVIVSNCKLSLKPILTNSSVLAA